MMGRVIQGYCLKPGKTTDGSSGTAKVWKEEHLREAADTLVGCPVSSRPSKDIDSIIGDVLYAEYIDGEGVRYEAEIHDAEIIEKIEKGMVDIAPRVMHKSPDDDETEPYVIREIQFDLLFVTNCAAESVPPIGPPGIEPDI